jgi:uncharacterized protein (DUF58 family)
LIDSRAMAGFGRRREGTTDAGVTIGLDELIALRQEAQRLDITPRGKVLATRSGGHLSRFRGRGMEFDESRVYQPGDEPRNMDWRVTARTGQPHVKLFREERERPVWLLVDQGPSMRFGTRVAFKSVIAARAAALLGWAARDKGDRVGGIVFDERHSVRHAPAAGDRGVLPVLRALADPEAGPREPGFGSLSEAAARLAATARSGSLVFLISDFRGLGERDSTWLARLGRTCELVLVLLFDPLEAAPPPPGLYAVSDGRKRSLMDMRARPLRDQWSQRFAAHHAYIERLSLQYRAHLVDLRTDEPVGETLHRVLGSRLPLAAAVR